MAGEPIVLIMEPKLGKGLRAWWLRNCWLYVEPSSWAWPRWWAAGTQGCCAVWYYRTPWGALHGAWVLHKRRVAAKRRLLTIGGSRLVPRALPKR